jgi:hypothetical protein
LNWKLSNWHWNGISSDNGYNILLFLVRDIELVYYNNLNWKNVTRVLGPCKHFI